MSAGSRLGSTLAFVITARDAGDALWPLAEDIAAHVRAGDQVIWVDDSGPGAAFHTSAVIGRFAALRGWPDGVRVDHISTGTRGQGDHGIALNLGLDAAMADRIILLPGTARLADGFAAARHRAEADDLDLITGPGGPKDLGAMILRRSLTRGLRAAEGYDSGGPLPFLNGLQRAAERPETRHETQDTPIAHLPPLDRLSPHWVALWGQEAAGNLAWALTLLPARLARLPVGGRAMFGAELAKAVPAGPLPDVSGAEIARAARDDGPEAFRLPAPAVAQPARLRLHLAGPHAHRMPLSYPALTPLWSDAAELTSDPTKADAVLYAHPRDLSEMATDVAEALDKRPNISLALLSEEPFWDTLFSPDPLSEQVMIEMPLGMRAVQQRNHHTSRVFDFDRIPYFLLTDDRYAIRYGRMFQRNAALTPAEWKTAFAQRPLDAAFMAERRSEPFHDLAHPSGSIIGLCAWRTRLAEGAQGRVARLGASWQDVPKRQTLDDWHAAKLAELDGQARVISGLENTHQPTYLSEKVFDAFACGARPLYMAGPAHRLGGMGLPQGAWVNLWGLTSDAAVAEVAGLDWDDGFYAAYAEAQQHLAALWSDAAILQAERSRLSRALVADLVGLVG